MSTPAKPARKSAGAFDIRNIIGSLLLIYGVILTGMGLFGDAEFAKTGNVNANLWAGLGLLVAGAFFGLWAWLKPILVPDGVAENSAGHDDHEQGPHRSSGLGH